MAHSNDDDDGDDSTTSKFEIHSLNVHLIDGTYELFRYYYGLPSYRNRAGDEVAATRGVLGSVISLLEDGASHVAVATDHVIESFRNDLWPGYKDGSGIEPDLRSQFEPLEQALRALGVAVWAMVEYEADDALAAGAAMAVADSRIGQIIVCTPDKDLAQCVVDDRIVQFDRRARKRINADEVVRKFGVLPESIPDYLALVGDDADGFPGLPGWGRKSAATVLARYRHIEQIPARAIDWDVAVRGAPGLAATLSEQRDLALLFRRLATLDSSAPVSGSVDELEWLGPTPEFAAVCGVLDAPELLERAQALAAERARLG